MVVGSGRVVVQIATASSNRVFSSLENGALLLTGGVVVIIVVVGITGRRGGGSGRRPFPVFVVGGGSLCDLLVDVLVCGVVVVLHGGVDPNEEGGRHAVTVRVRVFSIHIFRRLIVTASSCPLNRCTPTPAAVTITTGAATITLSSLAPLHHCTTCPTTSIHKVTVALVCEHHTTLAHSSASLWRRSLVASAIRLMCVVGCTSA